MEVLKAMLERNPKKEPKGEKKKKKKDKEVGDEDDEVETDDEDSDEDDGPPHPVKQPPKPNPLFEGMNKKQKEGMRQKLKRQRKREEALASKQLAAGAGSDDDDDDEAPSTAKQLAAPVIVQLQSGKPAGKPAEGQISNKLSKKLHGLDVDQFSFEDENHLKRYRSPHFPDKIFFSVSPRPMAPQLRSPAAPQRHSDHHRCATQTCTNPRRGVPIRPVSIQNPPTLVSSLTSGRCRSRSNYCTT